MPMQFRNEDIRILIIDDDEQVRDAHRRVVARAGYQARAADSVRAGLDAASEWKPDLILLDLVMPDSRGLQSLETLRAAPATRDAIVVAFSGVIVESDAPGYRAMGFDAIIPKPVDAASLVARIGEVLRAERGASDGGADGDGEGQGGGGTRGGRRRERDARD
jgi:DNA-binding response OmpR family regulator